MISKIMRPKEDFMTGPQRWPILSLNILARFWVRHGCVLFLFQILFLLTSCQDQVPQRGTITRSSAVEKNKVCEKNQEPVLEEGLVIDCKDPPMTRPDREIFWNTDFCACKDKKPISLGNCTAFCSSQATSGAETLFASFKVGEKISLGQLGNVYGFCTKTLNNGNETQNPECEIQAKDDDGNVISIPVTVKSNSNSLTSNIQEFLNYDKTYVLTLVEKSSGSKSDSVQFIKFSPDISPPVLGSLKISPISQYACMVRQFSKVSNSTDIYFDWAYRLHFYFIPRMPPRPVPAEVNYLFCHDIYNPLYGNIDQEMYPRFEQKEGAFVLWDPTDPRFYDINNNQVADVNDLIIQKTRAYGATLASNSNFFLKLNWPSSPSFKSSSLTDNSSSTTEQNSFLGYYMRAWVDPTTFKSFCLNSTHYNSNNPLYKAMRDIIGLDMEALYIAERAPESNTTATGETITAPSDYLLARESEIKEVWFYLKNGTPTTPTDENIANVAVYFHYPINKNFPFIRSQDQKIYRIRSASELGSKVPSESTAAIPTTYPPHDRRIGCVPKP